VANGNRSLAVDPYAHQPDSDWKAQRIQSDSDVLCRIFGMEPAAAYAGSTAFQGRERDFFRFLFAIRFLDHTHRNELKEDAAIFKVLATVFAIEGIAPADLGNQERIIRFLVRYLDRDEKCTLLHGFIFTDEYPLGGDRAHQRHLMFQQAIADKDFRKLNWYEKEPDYCSTGHLPLCFCRQWLGTQPDGVVNDYIGKFGQRLYKMRCAVVHDATPVLFGEARAEKPPDVAVWSFTLVDAFTVRGGGYVTYETGLPIPETVRILMNGLRRCFEDGAKF
jgi:hypothetical protein